MARTRLFDQVIRSVRLAATCEREGISTSEAIERAAERSRVGRREFLGVAGAAAAATLAPGCMGTSDLSSGASLRTSADVGVVGAGLAGLACADALAARGIVATVHEAADRVGGRCFSMGGAFDGPVTFPGQVVERGGEFIDTTHTTMRAYARELGLTLEDVSKDPGEVSYFFDGQHWPEAAVVDELRVFVDAMRDDLRTLGAPTALDFTEQDRALDLVSLAEYLDTRGASPLVRQVLDVAYNIEYGLETDRQSCLALLFFIHADRRSKFRPFGVFSDERFHVVEGNQAIASGLAARLPRSPFLGRRLVRVAKRSDGRIELTFEEGRRTTVAVHDAVVLTLPFSVLRGVELDASLDVPAWKTRAIAELQYGTNAKQMVAFTARPWLDAGSNGAAYSDLANLQTTWETNARNASATRGVITDYSGGDRGARLDPRRTQREATAFLADLERVFPGAAAAARRDARGNLVAHLEHWPSNPLSLGSYTANHPGYFTEIADLEGLPVGNLFFAGEHTDSFYSWQGFMEGAALSGLRAASEIIAAIR